MASPFFFENVTYWSEGDERAHFEWLGRIGCISQIQGVGTRVFLTVDVGAASGADLEELRAIYRRYDGDLSQLNSLGESAL